LRNDAIHFGTSKFRALITTPRFRGVSSSLPFSPPHPPTRRRRSHEAGQASAPETVPARSRRTSVKRRLRGSCSSPAAACERERERERESAAARVSGARVDDNRWPMTVKLVSVFIEASGRRAAPRLPAPIRRLATGCARAEADTRPSVQTEQKRRLRSRAYRGLHSLGCAPASRFLQYICGSRARPMPRK